MAQSKLKLVYIVTQAEWGGAQRYIFDLATALKDEFDVIVASGAQGNQKLLQKCQEAGIRTHAFKNLVRKINPIKDFTAVRELAEFFLREKPNIVHLNSSKASIIGSLSRYILNKFQVSSFKFQIIYTVHGWVFNEPLPQRRQWLYKQLERIACKIHNQVIVLSKADFDEATKNKICLPEKMTIIPHGIKQLDFFSRKEAREKLNYELRIMNYGILIGTVANLYKTKGINHLLEAAAILHNKGLEPNFIVIGSGPERKNYELRITNYGLNNFFLLGLLENAARYLKAFDTFVLPSVKEGMPYALLEAMQAGLPIIATNVGAIPEMLEDGVSGILVPPANPQALANAIQKLLNNQDLRQNLGHSASTQFQEKFNFSKMLNQTTALYKSFTKNFIIN